MVYTLNSISYLSFEYFMDTAIIGTKELRQRLPKVLAAVRRGQRFTVVRYAEPIAEVGPVARVRNWKYTFEDLKNLRVPFKTKRKDVSKSIDRIVYGV